MAAAPSLPAQAVRARARDEAASSARASAPGIPAEVGSAAWNQALNRTHAMAQLRARGGRVVRAIEERRRELVAARVRALRPRCVLDVGCEDGWLAEAYVAGLERLVLADLDPEVLAGSALAGRPGVVTVVADALQPEAAARALGPRGADVIVVSALLEHLEQPRAALDALRPLLAPGGAFVVYVPADPPILLAKRVLRWTRLGGLVRGLSLDPAPGHVQTFTRAAFARLLVGVGRVREIAFDPLALGYVAVVAPTSGGR